MSFEQLESDCNAYLAGDAIFSPTKLLRYLRNFVGSEHDAQAIELIEKVSECSNKLQMEINRR